MLRKTPAAVDHSGYNKRPFSPSKCGGDAMVLDAVANIVDRLRQCGFDPRKVGHDSWEARCPAHRSMDHALSITRNEFKHVVLACRSTQNCHHIRIVRALGITNDLLYAGAHDSLMRRSSTFEIQPASFKSPEAKENNNGSII